MRPPSHRHGTEARQQPRLPLRSPATGESRVSRGGGGERLDGRGREQETGHERRGGEEAARAEEASGPSSESTQRHARAAIAIPFP